MYYTSHITRTRTPRCDDPNTSTIHAYVLSPRITENAHIEHDLRIWTRFAKCVTTAITKHTHTQKNNLRRHQNTWSSVLCSRVFRTVTEPPAFSPHVPASTAWHINLWVRVCLENRKPPPWEHGGGHNTHTHVSTNNYHHQQICPPANGFSYVLEYNTWHESRVERSLAKIAHLFAEQLDWPAWRISIIMSWIYFT